MTEHYETQEPLEDQLPIPVDADAEERERIREENEAIRERNAERLANKIEVEE